MKSIRIAPQELSVGMLIDMVHGNMFNGYMASESSKHIDFYKKSQNMFPTTLGPSLQLERN